MSELNGDSHRRSTAKLGHSCRRLPVLGYRRLTPNRSQHPLAFPKNIGSILRRNSCDRGSLLSPSNRVVPVQVGAVARHGLWNFGSTWRIRIAGLISGRKTTLRCNLATENSAEQLRVGFLGKRCTEE